MLTIFTTPKPFTGDWAVSQSNAIGSWRALSPDVQILLFGNASGIRRTAQAFDAESIAEIKSTEKGVPYLNEMNQVASKRANHSILCFINADIVLPLRFYKILPFLHRFNRFLLVGHRYDLDWSIPIDFNSSEETKAFWRYAKQHFKRHSPSGIDYFVFRKGMWRNMPQLIPGRAGFDNWLIWKARRQFVPVIDASDCVKAVHLNHDYRHHPEGKKGVFSGQSAEQNRKAFKASWAVLNILDATWRISERGLEKKSDPRERDRFYNQLWRVFPEMAGVLILLKKLRNHFLLLMGRR
jgi:hypothetical protein